VAALLLGFGGLANGLVGALPGLLDGLLGRRLGRLFAASGHQQGRGSQRSIDKPARPARSETYEHAVLLQWVSA
jgi:hypothetical protein